MKRACLMAITMAMGAASLAAPGADRRAIPPHAAFRRFDAAAFAKPEAFFWPGYMWIWNDKLDPAATRAQLADMASHGAMAPMAIPEPREFRPVNMPTLLEPDYLSSGFMDQVRVAVDEAARLGMCTWLYDEGGWPSGSACGRVVAKDPTVVQRQVRWSWSKPKPGEAFRAPADCLVAYTRIGKEPWRRLEPGAERSFAEAGRALVITAPTSGRYPDLTNARATRLFIELTHEAYKRAVGHEFGKSIPLIFTDEPGCGGLPWPEDAVEDFRAKKGYDLRDRLFALIEPETDAERQVRVDYFDWWSDRFAQNYLGQIQEWCGRNGILSGGHLNGEDVTLGSRMYGFGQMLRALRRLDIPGVDVIWRQLWPGQANHFFPKYASTVARQEGGRFAMSESFAVFGNGMTPEQMKWLVDYQLVRGIQLFDLAAYPYSSRDWFMGGERPHFGPANPLWKHMPRLHAYIARMGRLMSLGRADCRTLLYFPVRDIWAGAPDLEQVRASQDDLANALLSAQREFDFVDDDALTRPATRVAAGRLRIGEMEYDTVLVSRASWIPEASMQRLKAFAAAGGRVVWVDRPSGLPAPGFGVAATRSDAVAMVTPVVRVEAANAAIRATGRRFTGGAAYLITNEGAGPTRCSVVIDRPQRPRLLDAETGRILRIATAQPCGEGWRVELDLPFGGSAALLCGGQGRAEGEAVPAIAETASFEAAWTLTPLRAWSFGEHDFEERPGDGRPVAALPADFSGEAEYSAALPLTEQHARLGAEVELSGVRFACEVEVNGKAVGSRLWGPWRFPVKGLLKPGANIVRVRVTNTLANLYVNNDALSRFTANQLGPYHPRAVAFERESVTTDLLGSRLLLHLTD